MPTCVVPGCGTCSSKGSEEQGTKIRYFSFPRDKEMQDKWMSAINKRNVNVKNARVCSRHFEEKCIRKDWRQEMYNYYPMRARALFPDSIPTLYLGDDVYLIKKAKGRGIVCGILPQQENSSAAERPLKRPAKELEKDNVLADANVGKPQSDKSEAQGSQDKTVVSLAAVPNKRRRVDLSNPQEVQKELQRLETENKALKIALLNRELGEDFRQVEAENRSLKAKLRISKTKAEYEVLEDEYFVLSERFKASVPKTEVVKLLSKMFTPGQIRAIFLPVRKNVKWSAEDISAAITLRSVSARAYQFLKNKRNIPLPGTSTLRKWLGNLKLEEGILESVLQSMTKKSTAMRIHEKLISLSFGETDVTNKIEALKKTTEKRGQRTCQCVMVRAIFAKWKQPVYYSHDKRITKEILLEIIERLYQSGFTVVSIVSDICPRNLKVWNDFNIGIDEDESCYFPHPNDSDLKIFVLVDAPSLLILIRNFLLDTGINVDGKMVTKECIERIITLRTPEMRIAESVNQSHLKVQGIDRQKLKLAAELLSDDVAKGLEGFGVIGDLQDYNWKETAELISTVNEWFQVFNCSTKLNETTNQSGYGLNLDEQITKLEKMTLLMGQIQSEDSSMMNVQKSVILNNCSLSQLFVYLEDKYSNEAFKVEYLLTSRLNMEVVVQLFSYLTARKDPTDKYSPMDFKYRLRWYMLGEGTDNVTEKEGGPGDLTVAERDKGEDKAEILTKDLGHFLKKKKRRDKPARPAKGVKPAKGAKPASDKQ